MSKDVESRHILCITKSTGGIAVYNRDLATHLASEGHRIHVLCLSENREAYVRELVARGLSASSLYMSRYKISWISDFKVALAIRTYLRTNPVSVVIAHGAKAGFLARLAGRLTGTPVIYAMHSMPFLERIQGRKAVLFRRLEMLGTWLGGHLVALTESMKKHIIENKIAPVSKVSTIYTGIDANALGKRRDRVHSCQLIGVDPDRPVVVWAGRLNRQKAPEIFLESAKLILNDQPQTQFYLAGEGPLGSALEMQAKRLNFGDSLIIAPWQKDVAIMLSACSVYVMTSRWEGLPLSLLEAMALECPVVATAVDGVAEAIRHDVDGLLVPSDDPQAVAEQVIHLLGDEGKRLSMGLEARKRVEAAFTIENMTREWDALIRSKALS